MPTSQSVYTTRSGEFRRIFRDLDRHPELRKRTPVVFCEGDSWFATPLSMNILDWLVYPSPEDEEKGVPVFGRGGLFYRAEESGDMAVDIFSPKPLKKIMQWYGGFDFDIALLSAGGNDFVGDFLKKAFANRKEMTVKQAYDVVVATGRFDEVYAAYEAALTAMIKLRPKTPIVAHTYCYPLKMNVAAELTVGNLGLAAIFKKNKGPWIGPHLSKALPDSNDQRAFARMLIDGFEQQVLGRLAKDSRFKKNFRYIDLRNKAPNEDDWFDEMHPKGATFKRLSRPFANEISSLFTL